MTSDRSECAPGNNAPEITDLLIRILNKAAAIENEPVDTGRGVLLHPSEVHLIDLAGRFPGESMTRYASRLGITRGAVSQTAKKLEEKGYIRRSHAGENNKTVTLVLTRSGEEAFAWHKGYHELVNQKLIRGLSQIVPEDRARILDALGRLEEVLDSCEDIRREHIRTFRSGSGKKNTG